MQLIGASLLTDYGVRHPEAVPVLRGLHALISEACWTGPADAGSEFRAVASFSGSGTMVLTIAEARLRVTLDVNYALGFVRAVSVSEIDDIGR
jgi:mRNA-degrading endonuclease HigB of HigAB toxin-antitoxin module